jgi:hypothetical protein
MDVTIRLPDGSGEVRKTLTPRVCEEISVRLRQIDMLLDTYVELDDEEDVPVRTAPKAGANGKPHSAVATPARSS